MQGRWDEALVLLRAAAFDLESREMVPVAHMLLCTASEILLDRGDVDAALALARDLPAPILTNVRNATLVNARISRALGDGTRARTLLEEQRAAAHAEGGNLWKLAEVVRELVELAVETGDDAGALVEELDDLAARTGWVECRLTTHRLGTR